MQPFTIVYHLSGLKGTVDEDGTHFLADSKWVSISFITAQLLAAYTQFGSYFIGPYLSFLLEYSPPLSPDRKQDNSNFYNRIIPSFSK